MNIGVVKKEVVHCYSPMGKQYYMTWVKSGQDVWVNVLSLEPRAVFSILLIKERSKTKNIWDYQKTLNKIIWFKTNNSKWTLISKSKIASTSDADGAHWKWKKTDWCDTNCFPCLFRYVAADTQLYIFAVVIFLMCRTNLVRKLVLSLLFVIGLIIPALYVYYQDLFGVLRPSLE